MQAKQDLEDLLHETLTQVSLELEAAALAAKNAANHTADKQALWNNIQRMYARLNQANYFIGRLQIFADDEVKRRQQGGREDET